MEPEVKLSFEEMSSGKSAKSHTGGVALLGGPGLSESAGTPFFPECRRNLIPITRRNLLHGMIAAAPLSVEDLASKVPNQPFSSATAPGPTLLNRNENVYGPSEKVGAVIREPAVSGRYPRGE